jgi:site-specific recombinase XerD
VEAERLSDRSVANIVKAHAQAVGLNPAVFSGHSLRSGFVTSALQSGADVLRVMDVTRHRQINTLKVYDRRAKAFKQHAGEAFL